MQRRLRSARHRRVDPERHPSLHTVLPNSARRRVLPEPGEIRPRALQREKQTALERLYVLALRRRPPNLHR